LRIETGDPMAVVVVGVPVGKEREPGGRSDLEESQRLG
jgi:hypothetical protein